MKNSCFPDERCFWPSFPCNIECDKPQGTIYNGPQAILTDNLEVERVDRAFFLGPKRLLKTKIFEKKKAIYPVKKRLWLIFSRDIEHDKCQGTVYKGSQGSLAFLCKRNEPLYLARRRSFETNISKNSCFHKEGSFWHIFPCIIECDKPQRKNYMGPQAILQLLWNLI